MDKGRVLLPWVFGLSMAGVAIALVVSATRPAPGLSRAPLSAAVAVLPAAPAAVPAIAAKSASAPLPAPPPPAAPDLAAVPVPSATPSASGAQIWECRTNGQRTFSDKPCGDKPVLREVNTLNIMNPTPVFPAARSYEAEPSYAPAYFDPSAQEPAEGAYPVVVGYPVPAGYPYRRRPDHTHRPHPEHHGPTARKIQ
jgi:hypothetical protein